MHTAAQQSGPACPTAGMQAPPHLRHGPVQVWLCPHPRGQRGQALATQMLAAALGDAALLIERDARGRPQLLGAHAGHDANWSHSGELLLLALGEAVAVGVDLEHLRPRPRAAELARRFFHPDETARLLALPATALPLAFVRLWCAKEAVLKAHGHGIAFGLDKLVFEERDTGLQLSACDPALGAPADWQLREWEPQPGYRAALAWRLA